MRHPLAVLALCLSIAPALAAQDKPTPAMQQGISGTWKIDAARSDVIPENPLAGARGLGAVQGGNPTRAGATAGSAGGRGGSRGGGGGGGGGGGAADAGAIGGGAAAGGGSAGQPGGGGGGGRGMNANLQLVLAEANPGAGIVIAANDSIVAIATANMLKGNPNGQSNWKTDGKKHQDALMDGTILESESGWKDGVLTISYGAIGFGTFVREFKVSKDGKTLELKEIVQATGRKAEYKLEFIR